MHFALKYPSASTTPFQSEKTKSISFLLLVSSANVHVWCDMVKVSKLLFCFINEQFIIKTHSNEIQNIFNLKNTTTNMVGRKTNEINNKESGLFLLITEFVLKYDLHTYAERIKEF